jgi:hypothetical protein
MDTEGSLPWSQDPTNGPHPEAHEVHNFTPLKG